MGNILQNPFKNKGTAFTESERKHYHLKGLLPTKIEDIQQQAYRIYKQLDKAPSDYEKHKILMDVYDENRVLFFHVLGERLTELLPVIYTPTIATAVTHYSEDFKPSQRAAFLSINKPDEIKESLLAASQNLEEVKLLVITDGEGILGIGDWGIQGGHIAVGKLAVYTLASGMNPKHILPVVIDAGTNNEELLHDPLYIGLQQKRANGEKYFKFIDSFVQEASQLFPNVLFHWEDFGRDHAASILEKYQNEITTFNDDIQGTGIMMVSAVESVASITEKPLEEHRVLIFGAGTAGTGVANQLATELQLKGKSEKESRQNIYLFDRNGLITSDMEELTEGQKKYARNESEFGEPVVSLEEAIDKVKPSILIGTSGQPATFTKSIVEKMASYYERPAIFPISNPTNLAEASASDIIEWTKGKGLVVTGSPSDPIEYNGTNYTFGQANNALLYPGLGFGTVIAQAERVTNHMLSAAASGIISLQNLEELGAGLLPPVDKLQEASKLVAKAVIKAAIEDGVCRTDIDDIDSVIEEAIWKPEYSVHE